MMRDWFIIATVIAVLWGMWLFLNFVFDLIEDYHASRREERLAATQPSAEDGGKLVRGKAL